MKKFIAILMTVAVLFTLMACAAKDEPKQDDSAPEAAKYADSLEIMNLIWDRIPDDGKFACFGGNQNENATMDAPDSFDVADANGMTYLLLIPEAEQKNIDNAASVVHLMNANTFTGAVIHVNGADAASVANAIKENVTNNQFMCGFPDKLLVLTVGDYIIYAFGAEDMISNFKTAALQSVEGTTLVCEESLI